MDFHRCFFRLTVLYILVVLCHCPTAFGAERFAFSRGSYGFLIEQLNHALAQKLGADATIPSKWRAFSEATESNIGKLRQRAGLAVEEPPVADPAVYRLLDLPFPSELGRCFHLIDCWEGTFKKLEGPAESGDVTPMVTYGIIGFTSNDGSLQWFLYHCNKRLGGALKRRVAEVLGAAEAEQFEQLIAPGERTPYLAEPIRSRSNQAWVEWALVSRLGKAKRSRVELFESFNQLPGFLDAHLDLCAQKAWEMEAKPTYLGKLFGKIRTPSLQAKFLCVEMTVLTSGPKQREAWLAAQPYTTEAERFPQIIEAMAHAGYPARKTADIVERETVVGKGSGIVHGSFFDLKAYGIIPR